MLFFKNNIILNTLSDIIFMLLFVCSAMYLAEITLISNLGISPLVIAII